MSDFRSTITRAVMADLTRALEESPEGRWRRPWNLVNAVPGNPTRGHFYRGGNRLVLANAMARAGSDDPRFVTLKQANAAGLRVKAGAKGVVVQYWDFGQRESRRAREMEADGEVASATEQEQPGHEAGEEASGERTGRSGSGRPRVFHAVVFNGADIEGLAPLRREQRWAPNELADALVQATGARIEHTTVGLVGAENAEFYQPGEDRIVMPPKSSFESEGDYYAVLMHELSHWTGAASRLAREFGPKGSEGYAREELRADIGGSLLCAMVGIEGDVVNHSNYARSWLEALGRDKHEYFRAAADAEKIVDYVFSFAPQLRAQTEEWLKQENAQWSPGARARREEVSEPEPEAPAPQAVAAAPEEVPGGRGRFDPRWSEFEASLRAGGASAGIEAAFLERALTAAESSFSEVMDRLARIYPVNIVGPSDGRPLVNAGAMFASEVLEDLKAHVQFDRGWERFSESVREGAAVSKVLSAEGVAAALAGAKQQWSEVLQTSAAQTWSVARTQAALDAVLYGPGGVGEVDAAFLLARFPEHVAAPELAPAEQAAEEWTAAPETAGDPEDDPDADLELAPYTEWARKETGWDSAVSG